MPLPIIGSVPHSPIHNQVVNIRHAVQVCVNQDSIDSRGEHLVIINIRPEIPVIISIRQGPVKDELVIHDPIHIIVQTIRSPVHLLAIANNPKCNPGKPSPGRLVPSSQFETKHRVGNRIRIDQLGLRKRTQTGTRFRMRQRVIRIAPGVKVQFFRESLCKRSVSQTRVFQINWVFPVIRTIVVVEIIKPPMRRNPVLDIVDCRNNPRIHPSINRVYLQSRDIGWRIEFNVLQIHPHKKLGVVRDIARSHQNVVALVILNRAIGNYLS